MSDQGRWTTEPPTEPGWYWWRDAVDSMTIVHLDHYEDYRGMIQARIWFAGSEVEEPTSYQNGEFWLPRIERPGYTTPLVPPESDR